MSILEILEAHDEARWNQQGHKVCACGHEYTDGYGSGFMLAHVAQVLEQHERERCYEAWSSGWHDSHYQHTAHNERRGQGHPEVTYSNPYRSRQ